MKGQRSLLLKGAAWVSAASILVNLLGIASLIALTRLLVPEDFGLVAIATAFSEIIGVVTELSLAMALVQRRGVEPVHFHTAFTMNVLRGLLVAALVVLVAPLIAEAYGDPRLTLVIQVQAIGGFIASFGNPRLILFQRDLDFSRSFIMQVTNKLVAFIVAVAVAYLYQTYWALVVGSVAAAFATVITSYILIPYRPRVSLAAWRDLLSFSIWLTLGRWIQALNWRAQPLLFGFFLPTAVVGQYNVGRRLVGQTIAQATQPVKSVLFPAFSRLQDEAERLRGGYMRSQGTICLVTFPMAAGFAFLAEDLVLLTIGEKWLPAVPVIQLVAVIRALQAVQNVNALAMATANTKALFYRDLRAFVIRWPLLLGGMFMVGDDPYDMLLGALVGQIAAVLVNNLWNVQLIAKISTITIRDHFAFCWRPAVGVAVMGAVVLTAHSASPPLSDWTEIAIRAVILSALGAATYLASLYVVWFATGRKDCIETELFGIVRNLIAKLIARTRAA